MISQSEKYSHIQASGEDISSVVRGISAEALCKVLLNKYELNNVQKGQYYPVNNYLSLLYDIEKRMPAVLKNIGKSIISEALFPPDVTIFEEALVAADTGYYMNHLGAEKDEIGHYLFEKKSEKHFHMIVDSPYPCIFDEGVILGIAEKFNEEISLKHDGDACRSKGDQQCNYHIEIKG